MVLPRTGSRRGAILPLMGSGAKVEVFNLRERLLSPDFNRMQRFAGAALSQLALRMFGQAAIANAAAAPGIKVDPTVVPGATAPVSHRVVGGLMVRCDAPGYLTVDAGSAAFWKTDYSTDSDDSDWILIDSAGVTSTGTLTFSTNAGPGIRIDVVECTPSEVVTEQESRDIYNTDTALYTPTLVNKVKVGSLTFRIRQGTAGAGIPDNQSGWCPLAVVAVTSTATGFSTCDVYDVRPLLDPAVLAPETAAPAAYVDDGIESGPTVDPRTSCHAINISDITLAKGWFGASYRGYSAGGPLWKGSPPSSYSAAPVYYVDADDATNYSNDNPPSLTANQRNCLTCLLPSHFYRFVRYNATATDHTATAGRLPVGPNGVYTFCGSITADRYGNISGVRMPTTTGVTGACGGPVVAELSNYSATRLVGFSADARIVRLVQYSSSNEAYNATSVAVSAYARRFYWTLNPSSGTSFKLGGVPRDARYVIAQVAFFPAWSPAASENINVELSCCSTIGAGGELYNELKIEGFTGGDVTRTTDAATLTTVNSYVRIPLFRHDSITTKVVMDVLVRGSGTVNWTTSYASLLIVGYER
jgi:hypothetical protein